MATRVDDLPIGTSALRLDQAGLSVIFTAIAGADPRIYGSGTTELYAVDIARKPPAKGLFLPLLRR